MSITCSYFFMREEKELAETLGPRIRAARKAKGLTSVVCAKFVNVSQPAWNMWEVGKRLPKIELLVAICDLLDTTPNVLLGFDPPPSAAPSIKTGDNSPVAIGNNITQNVNAPKKKDKRK